jgi:hypothetical protein
MSAAMDSPAAADIATVLSPPGDVPPDWATLGHDILCPLCDYNLRGLLEPRCPECGHHFVWRRLLDARERQHPYLFEHHPRRNLVTLIQTFWHSLRPGRFWRTLQPIHTPVVRRMVIYWVVMATLVAACGVLMTAAPLYRYYSERQYYQSRVMRVTSTTPPLSWFIQQVINQRGRFALTRTIVPIVLCCLLWPWLTFLSLLLYRASLRQARIRSAHVLRCSIYSADLAVLAVLPLYLGLSVWNDPYRGADRWRSYYPLGLAVDETIVELGFIMLLLLGYRTWVAYRRYLNFPHAAAAVLASQTIVGLALFKGYLAWNGM